MTYETRSFLKKFLRYAIMITVSAAIGVFFGQLLSNYELRFMAARSYQGEYNGIEIYTAGDVDENNMSGYLYMLSCAPDALTECCDRLYFTGSELDIPANDAGVSSALGLTQGRTIYISTDCFGMEVMFHELFHAYDNSHGELSAHSDGFRRAYDSEWDNIYVAVGYDDMHASEFFAQAGAFYLLAPAKLRNDAPLSFEYFDGIFGYYSEKTTAK